MTAGLIVSMAAVVGIVAIYFLWARKLPKTQADVPAEKAP
jgi:hypothetical protein